jgi:hypothetical protein
MLWGVGPKKTFARLNELGYPHDWRYCEIGSECEMIRMIRRRTDVTWRATTQKDR